MPGQAGRLAQSRRTTPRDTPHCFATDRILWSAAICSQSFSSSTRARGRPRVFPVLRARSTPICTFSRMISRIISPRPPSRRNNLSSVFAFDHPRQSRRNILGIEGALACEHLVDLSGRDCKLFRLAEVQAEKTEQGAVTCSFLVISGSVIHIEDLYSVFRILASNEKVNALSERQTVVMTACTVVSPDHRVYASRLQD